MSIQKTVGPADHGSESRRANTVAVTDETFAAAVLSSDLPVLVDIWATWCRPCRQIAPILESLAGEYAGRLVIAKLDADANPATAAESGVVSIPTLNFYSGGQLVKTVVGAHPKNVLVAAIEEVLA